MSAKRILLIHPRFKFKHITTGFGQFFKRNMSYQNEEAKEQLVQVRRQRAISLRKTLKEKSEHPHCQWNLSDVVNTENLDKSHPTIYLHRGLTGPEGAEGDRDSQGKGTRITLWQGDITSLDIDVIVNAANSSLAGGGGVDGAIHAAASYELLQRECRIAHGHCDTGDSKLTSGYLLPAKYVLHAVGPQCYRGYVSEQQRSQLNSCYESCLRNIRDHNTNSPTHKVAKPSASPDEETQYEEFHEPAIRSLAFPCISTGIYGYPARDAAQVALETVCDWLIRHPNEVDQVIFCVFLDSDRKIYERLFRELNDSRLLDVCLLSKLVDHLTPGEPSLPEKLSISMEDIEQSCPPGVDTDSPLATLLCWNQRLVEEGCGFMESVSRLADSLELREGTMEDLIEEYKKPRIPDLHQLSRLCQDLEKDSLDQSTLLEMLEISLEEVKQSCPRGLEEESPLAALVCWCKEAVNKGLTGEKCLQKLKDLIKYNPAVRPSSPNGDET